MPNSRFQFRIGSKLAIITGMAVVLVGGMTANQLSSNNSVDRLSADAAFRRVIVDDLVAAHLDLQRAQLAVRDMRLADAPDAITAAYAVSQQRQKAVGNHLNAALGLVDRAENRERMQKVLELNSAYEQAAADLYKASGDFSVLLEKRHDATVAFTKAIETLLASPSLASLANRQDVERVLMAIGTRLEAAHRGSWRYAAKHEPAQEQLVVPRNAEIVELIARARGLVADKTMSNEIDSLRELAATLAKLHQEISANISLRANIGAQRAMPIAREADEILTKGVEMARGLSEASDARAGSERAAAGRLGIGLSLVVILILIGSTVFSMVNIARPVRRIGEVLIAIANGNKAIDIPYLHRGDEVGDNARAAAKFKDNLLRIERMEVEKQQEDAERAARRRE